MLGSHKPRKTFAKLARILHVAGVCLCLRCQAVRHAGVEDEQDSDANCRLLARPSTPSFEEPTPHAHEMRVSVALHGADVEDATCRASWSGAVRTDALEMSYQNGSLCITGSGFQTRAESQSQLVRDAVQLMNRCRLHLMPFKQQLMSLRDSEMPCDRSWGFVRSIPECQTRLVPDFSFVAWPEAGLLPDYRTLREVITQLSSRPPTKHICGWAGNVQTNPLRGEMLRIVNRSLFEIMVPEHDEGVEGRISMPDQVRRWACLLDVPAAGYSGRVPLLLSSGRPLLLVGREHGQLADQTWYADKIKPWEHYIPVAHDLSDLNAKAAFVLGPGREQARDIAKRAKQFAAEHLTYNAAVAQLAEALLLPLPVLSHG